VEYSHRGQDYTIHSKYVIAAADLPMVYNKLLPEALVPQKIKKRLEKAELYASSVTISIALDCPVEDFGFNEEMVHLTSAAVSRSAHAGGDPLLTEISILAPSFRDKTLAPAGMGTLVLFMPADIAYEQQWRTGKDAEGNRTRGDAYKELKNIVALQLIKRVEEKIAPGLQKHILFFEVATPIIHWRYTGNTRGSMMATKPNKFNMMNKVAAYRTPVKNLLIGGHWAELGGGVPIAVKAGANAALLVLKKENKPACRALKAYLDGRMSAADLQSGGTLQPYDNNWVQQLTPAQKKAVKASV
jgi:phytoene dehydrogenase-like protein